jgi:hypothetical protein
MECFKRGCLFAPLSLSREAECGDACESEDGGGESLGLRLSLRVREAEQWEVEEEEKKVEQKLSGMRATKRVRARELESSQTRSRWLIWCCVASYRAALGAAGSWAVALPCRG